MKNSPLLIILLFVSFSTFALAQDEKKKDDEKTNSPLLTVDRLFKDKEFETESPGPITWSKNGSYYFSLEAPAKKEAEEPEAEEEEDEPKEEPGDEKKADKKDKKKKPQKSLVKVDPKTDEKTILATPEQLTPEKSDRPLGIASFTFSDDESQVLLFTNTKKVWRHNTRGDYWLLNLKDHTLAQLGGDAPASSMMFAKFSKDGSHIAYVSQNNLFIQNLSDLKITQLTTDGSDTLINGVTDWVNEEEFGQRDAFRWHPDGTSLLFWQFDAAHVKKFWLLDQTQGKYPVLTSFPYPKAGETNSSIRLGVIPIQGGETTWLKIPGDPRDYYLPEADWNPDGSSVIAFQFNRLQNELKLFCANPTTGEAKAFYTETDPAWIEHINSVRFIDNDLLWLSDTTGWLQLSRISPEGKVTPITEGNFDVIDLTHFNSETGDIYYIASPDKPTQRYLFHVSAKGGPSTQVSPDDQPGTHSYNISEDGKLAIHTYSTFTTPPTSTLVSLPDHKPIRTLKDQDKLRDKLASLTFPKAEFLRLKNDDGLEFDAYMITPPNFDPSKKYPLLMHVYGEPHGQTVKDSWGGPRALWHTMLAQQGFVVGSVDTRGAYSPKGHSWRKSSHLKLGAINSNDHADATRALLKKYSFLDPERVGIWGWSGGGSSTLSAMFRHPDLYKTGIAVAPVADLSLYDTIYEERYMGLPNVNKEGYKDGSPITHAANLKGNLLIIHGTGDDNVHYQGTEKLVNELIKHNKQFTIMPYPNRDHAIHQGPGTTPHLYKLMTNYLTTHLKNTPTP